MRLSPVRLVAASIALSSLLAPTLFELTAAEDAYVRSMYAHVRNRTTLPMETIATLQQNTKVTVLSHQGSWSQVMLADGRTGWIEARSLDDDEVSKGGFWASAGKMSRSGSGDVTGTAGGKGVGPVTKEYAKSKGADAEQAMQQVQRIEDMPQDFVALDAFMQEGGLGAHQAQ